MFKSNRSMQSIALIAREKPKAVAAVCACLVLASLMEAMGVSAIFPFITLILETDATLPDSRLADLINKLTVLGPAGLSLVIIGAFSLKSVIMVFMLNIVAKSVSDFSHELRTEFLEAMLNARIHFIMARPLGESLSVLSNDSIRAAAAYTASARVLAGLAQLFMYGCYALWLSVEATLLSGLTMVVIFLLVKRTMSRTRKAGAKTTQHIHDIARSMGEALRAIKEVKATNRETYLGSYIVEASDSLRDAHKTNIITGQLLRFIQDPVTVASALVCLLIFKEVLQLEPGYILFILAVYYRMMSAANTLMSDYQKFLGQETALWAVKDGAKHARDAKERLNDTGAAPEDTPQEIVFDDVSMRYGAKEVFSHVSFVVPPRTLCLFKGESGRGKTTGIDIICSLVEPTGGKVLVGGKSLRDLNTGKWRERIGYVDQFPFLFRGTVRENILLGLTEVPEEKIKECLRLCHLDKFVAEAPGGLDFELHEGGANISGGQRQRIAIARSVIRDPFYLVLDEPTSALDQESADVLFQTLKSLSEAMSVIVISHSPAIESYADKVVDFDRF